MSEDQKPKRKTHTSSEVINRYKKKTYSQIGITMHKEVAEKYKEKCRKCGIPYTKLLHEAIKNFLGKDEN